MSNPLQPHGLPHARLPCPLPSNHLILCHPLLFLPSIITSIMFCFVLFSNELTLHSVWPMYWSFNFKINPSNEYSELMFFKIDWFDLLATKGTLKSLLQHHSLKTSSSLLCLPYCPFLTPVHDHWKDHSLDYTDLCQQSDVFVV